MSYHTYIDWTTEEAPRPFYVGKGTQRRVDDMTPRNAVHARIAEKHGLRREVVLMTEDEAEAFACEVRLITELRTFAKGGEGWWGANLTLGGDGAAGYRHTPEHRQHISAVLTGRRFSDEHRANLSVAQQGRKHTDETKKKCSDAAHRRIVTDETREKIAEGNRRRTVSAETRQKMSASRKGRRLSETTRQRMSSALAGRKRPPFTEEHKRRIAEARRRFEVERQQQLTQEEPCPSSSAGTHPEAPTA